jgi:hypothetical protein
MMSVFTHDAHALGHLPTKLLGNAECLHLGAELTERENLEYGPDFTWSCECAERWLHSGSMFYSTMTSATDQIVALTSVLLTGQTSSTRLLRGEVREQELLPWFLESLSSPPVLYFASVISEKPSYLPLLYDRLLFDVENYMVAHQVTVSSGLSIALGPQGFRHLSGNGFVALDRAFYLKKYQFMHIDGVTARTEFWRRLLRSDALEIDRFPSRPITPTEPASPRWQP